MTTHSTPDQHHQQPPAGDSLQAPRAVGKPPIGAGDSTHSQSNKPPLPLPHERDESVGEVASTPDPVIEQAARDIASGQVDTDMRSTGGQTDARREQLLRKDRA